MVCTEPVTRNPCCDTNSQIAGEDTLGVITVHTCTQTYWEGPGACSMVEDGCLALVCSLLCRCPCAQRLRAGIPWGMHRVQQRHWPGSELGLLPTGGLDGKRLECATLSLHPSAAPPRGEHCPVAHGINHVSPRDYGTSEQVKQVMEEAAQFLPYTVAELSQEKSRQLRGLPASVRTGLQCSWGKKIARLTHQPLKSYWKYCCSSDYILLLI